MRPHPPADVKELVHPFERRVHDDRAGRLGGDLALMAEGDADGGRRQRRRVVDAVADEQRRRARRFGPGDGHLLLGTLTRVHLGDADVLGEIAHLVLAIARDQQHAVEVVPRPEMADERPAVVARRVAEAEGRGVPAIDDAPCTRGPRRSRAAARPVPGASACRRPTIRTRWPVDDGLEALRRAAR